MGKVQALQAQAHADPYDLAVWEQLLGEITRGRKSPEQTAQLRTTYEDILTRFPTAAFYWREYAELEIEEGTPESVKALFSRCLLTCLDVDLWRAYLRFIRRLNDPRNAEGLAEVRQAFEFTVDHVGQDLRSGPVWQDYIAFLTAPKAGSVEYVALFGDAPEGQEDSQRTVALRRAYQRALLVPSAALDALWAGYERFEGSSGNRTLGRRILDEWRPRFQGARTLVKERTAKVDRLDARVLPLPPGRGGAKQARAAAAWRDLLQWERSNLQRLDEGSYRARVTLAYEQALTVLLHYADVWLDYASWHVTGGGAGPAAALTLLHKGRRALPAALALHFAAAEAEEAGGNVAGAAAVYEGLVQSLTADSEAPAAAAPAPAAAPQPKADPPAALKPPAEAPPRDQEAAAAPAAEDAVAAAAEPTGEVAPAAAMGMEGSSAEEAGTDASEPGDDRKPDAPDAEAPAKGADAEVQGEGEPDVAAEAAPVPAAPGPAVEAKDTSPAAAREVTPSPGQGKETDATSAAVAAPPPPAKQAALTPQAGSLVWVHYMRFMRRVEGIMAARKVFLRARKWPSLRWEAFVGSALLEWAHEAKDVIPRNIFELGLKSFIGEPGYVLQYASFLRGLGDVANTRALFERALTAASPSSAAPLWDEYLRFEHELGTMAAAQAVEARRHDALASAGALGPLDAAKLAEIKYRHLDLWPGSTGYFTSLLGRAPAAAASAPNVEAPSGPPREERGPPPTERAPRREARPHRRDRSRSRTPPPPRRARGSPEPIRQFPRELGLLLNALSMAPDGPVPDIEKIVEIIVRADFSLEGIEAHEAAAAKERRRQRHAREQQRGGGPPGGGPPAGYAGGKRKAPPGGGPPMLDDSDSESSGDDDEGGMDVYRRRMRARV